MADKVTIGVTSQNKNVMDMVVASNYFEQEMDVAKLAMSLAIKNRLELGSIGSTGTIWNIGSFDQDGQIKAMINIFFPNIVEHYRQAEILINKGLEFIETEVNKNGISILDDLIQGK